jgi:hypothetical protein
MRLSLADVRHAGIGSLALHDTTLYAAYCCGDAGGEVVRFDL